MKNKLSEKEKRFIKEVWDYYKANGRNSLLWRKTKNPYHILISEVMLQQTQVDRVIPKYKSFLKKFPTIKALSKASLGEVLREWQGLGYNRRAKMLHECGKVIVGEYQGRFPTKYKELVELPGIGSYTAGAVLAFAYGEAIPIIETNIRTVVLHSFFNDQTDVPDAEIGKVVDRTLDKTNPREWYYALMDYGAYIKKEFGNPNSRSKHYTKQSTFKGSDREIRGAILRLLARGSYTRAQFLKQLPFEDIRIDTQVENLLEEEMIKKTRDRYTLP